MIKFIVILAVLIISLPSQAGLFKKYKEKGNSFMDGQIIPIEVKVKDGLTATASLKYNNKFGCLTGGLDFALASLDEKLHVTCNVIIENSPGGDYAGVFGADETGKFMWCKSGWREAIIVDTESKKSIRKMASFNGNTFINAYVAVVAKDKFVYTSVKEAEGPQTYSVFDFTSDTSVAVIDKLYFSFILMKQEDSCLLVSIGKDKKRTWKNAILKKDDILFLPDDGLTDELTDKQLQYNYHQKTYSFIKNILIGKLKVDDLMEPFSIRWNPEKSEIKIEPLLLQCPKPDVFYENWEFSLDGNWCMNKVLQKSSGNRLIVFYKVDNAFPNGLSTPIYGGLTSEGNKGCFINHDVLGPLYLDIPPSGDPVIYKLNQIPELLKSAVK
jgi:hypothetical protein